MLPRAVSRATQSTTRLQDAGRPACRRTLRRSTAAYHEIWLTDDPDRRKAARRRRRRTAHDVEPIYGQRYLPRKFKTAVGLPDDNCVDLYANDLGLMAIVENDQIVGYNVLVGGGMGVTPSGEEDLPRRRQAAVLRHARRRCIDVAEAIVKVQRDFGNRADRKVARLKYLIHNWGLPKFKAKVEEYYGRPLRRPAPDRRHRLRRPHGLARARRRPAGSTA